MSVRKTAAQALGVIGDIRAVHLIEAINDGDWQVRKFAAVALGKMNDEKALFLRQWEMRMLMFVGRLCLLWQSSVNCSETPYKNFENCKMEC